MLKNNALFRPIASFQNGIAVLGNELNAKRYMNRTIRKIEMIIRFQLILFIAILFYGCSNSTSPSNEEEAFGIYLLKDTLLITSEAKKLSVDVLLLQETPLISINDIVEYNWEEQVISLTSEAFTRFKGVEKSIKSIYGLPFVVMANQQKIYLGNIYPMYSSYFHQDLPFISVAPFVELRIGRAPLLSIEDKRKDERIYNVMDKFNKIKK